MGEKENVLSEIKTNLRVLRTWGNVLVPALEGQKETSAQDRLAHFVNRAMTEFGMTMDEIEVAVA